MQKTNCSSKFSLLGLEAGQEISFAYLILINNNVKFFAGFKCFITQPHPTIWNNLFDIL